MYVSNKKNFEKKTNLHADHTPVKRRHFQSLSLFDQVVDIFNNKGR